MKAFLMDLPAFRRNYRRILSVTALSLLPLGIALPAAAACNGIDLRREITPTQQTALDEILRQTPYSEGLFWQARRGDREITLAGTIHLNDPRLAPLADRLAPYVSEAEHLLVEADPEDQARFTAELGRAPERILITEGPTLIDLMPAEDWQDIAARAQEGGIPPLMAAKMRPWFLALSLAIPPCARAIADLQNGLDKRLIAVAQAADVPVSGLEDPFFLFELFNADPIEQQVAELRSQISMLGTTEDDMSTLIESYFDQDVQAFAELQEMLFLAETPAKDRDAARAQLDETMQSMLVARNHAWIPVIEATKGNRITVAVGALHLPGDDGVLALLKAEGYEITPLKLP